LDFVLVECTVSQGPSSIWTWTPEGSAGVVGVETFGDTEEEAVFDVVIVDD
jgi:hypothetical protein